MYFEVYGELDYIDPHDVCEEHYEYIERVKTKNGECYQIIYNLILGIYEFTEI